MSKLFDHPVCPEIATPTPKDRQYCRFTVDELVAYTFPASTDDIIREGVLRGHSILILFGLAKAMKSFVLYNMCVDLVLQKPLFGANSRHATRVATPRLEIARENLRVLFLEQELGAAELKIRLLPLLSSLTLGEKVTLGSNLASISGNRDLVLDTDDGVARIIHEVQDFGADVLAIDSLIEFHTSDENNSKDMAKVMRGIDAIRKHCAVMLSHHKGHPGPGTKDRDWGGRGSSVIEGFLDTGLDIKLNRSTRILDMEFNIRRGRPVEPFKVQLDPATLRTNFLGWGRSVRRTKGEEDLQIPVQ